MKIAYASRTGNVEAFVKKLGLRDTLFIENGSEDIFEDYIVITYTDGYGDVPSEVEEFLSGNSGFLRGVAASGDRDYGEAYCAAADVISDMYGVPVLGKFEFDGNDDDVANLLKRLEEL